MLDGRFKAPQEPKPSTSVDKVKLRVADQYEWYIDKTTLTEKSKFFGTMLSGGWQEDVEGVINLPEDEPDLVARMVLWARYGKYPSSPQVPLQIKKNQFIPSIVQLMQSGNIDKTKTVAAPSEPTHLAMLHLEVYLIAEKYNLPDLETYALKECRYWLYHQSDAKEAWYEMVDVLPDASDSAMPEIKKIIVEYGSASLLKLGGRDGENFVRAHPDLAGDIIAHFWSDYKRRYWGVGPLTEEIADKWTEMLGLKEKYRCIELN